MPTVHYLADTDVDAALDAQLRALLSECFGNVFKDKRYCYEMPPHRWLIRAEDGTLAAHLAAHDKVFRSADKRVPFTGVAEVCVAPEYRGRGYVRALLAAAEAHTSAPFALLVGDAGVYGSSGYRTVDNVHFPAKHPDPHPDVMAKALRGEAWPEGGVVIEGMPF